jgi:hypothetical protein
MRGKATWSDSEPSQWIESAGDLERFIAASEARCKFPVAIELEVHGYRADLLVGHEQSFIHMTPLAEGAPYFVTIGGPAGGYVEFWLCVNHHTEFETRHRIDKSLAREAFVEFYRTGTRSSLVQWERYEA